MTDIRTQLAAATEMLASRIDAEVLVAFVLNQSRSYLYTHPEALLSPDQTTHLMQLVEARKRGVPIAYLTGLREFWSMPLMVTPATLIPRPETEKLVELTLEQLKNKTNACVLDLGTGSGAIALALAKERPDWKITAADRSEEALVVARANAARFNIKNVDFYQSDWFTNLPPQRYHAIVSNPPYIAEQDPHLKQGDLRFEPRGALVSGENGLEALRFLIQDSYDYLFPDGILLVEHGYLQKNALESILYQSGYTSIQSWQDWQGNDRVSGGRRP